MKYVADVDKSCGLSSAKAAISNIDDAQSMKAATATYAVTNCVVDFGQKTEISQDCLGNKTYASGKVKLNAKQIRHGIRTSHHGHYAVIPWPHNQVEFELDVTEFDNYKVWVSNRAESMTVVSGQALAKLTVNLSHDPTTGFCSVPTPEIKVNHIRYKDAVLELPGPFGRFRLPVQDSEISAQAGNFGDLTNHLSGTMTVWGEVVQVPNDKKGLDPEFDANTHRESFQCNLKTENQVPNYTCDAKKELAIHAARLLVLNTAMVIKAAHAEKEYLGCGFDNLYKKVLGCNAEHHHLLVEAYDCVIGADHDLPVFHDKDCANEHLYMMGNATIVEGRMRVDGKCGTGWSKRNWPDHVTFFLDSVKLTSFSAFYSAHGRTAPVGKLIVKDGHLSAVVKPIFAENFRTPAYFDIQTPVAVFEQIKLNGAASVLWLNPSRITGDEFSIPLTINNSELFAQNGLFRGVGNYLRGHITVDGEQYTIDQAPLNPDFDAEKFDFSYASCEPDLKIPVSPN